MAKNTRIAAHDRQHLSDPQVAERRKYPRLDGAALVAERVPVDGAHGESRTSSAIVRLQARWATLLARRRTAWSGHTDRMAVRRARLQSIARRLDAVLAELDELGAWRAAGNVCSALERLREGSADAGATGGG